MGVNISYMGTKRKLATRVSQIISELPEGPLLDAFSGMCAIGEAVGPARQVWANDIQTFPALVAKALLCAQSSPPCSESIGLILQTPFSRNLNELSERYKAHLVKEERYFSTKRVRDAIAANTAVPYIGNNKALEQERKRLARRPSTFPYRLATITYAGSFFGVKQSMEMDSLRYAMDVAEEAGRITSEQRAWLLIALGLVASRINNSTGQFAQYIKPRGRNLERTIKQRRRSVWDEFHKAIGTISPVGTSEWRAGNRSYRSDATSLARRMKYYRHRPSIVYADPPYSAAQYSRYYHVLDVLVEYDYPSVTGMGRYPGNRFQTPFSHSGAIATVMDRFFRGIKGLGAFLVLSYPENGLFNRNGGNLVEHLAKHFSTVELVHSETHSHSTFGGPKALPKVQTQEQVYLAYP